MLSQQVIDEAHKVAKQHLNGDLNVSVNIEVLQKILSDEDMSYIFILCTRQISQNPYPIRILPS
jgi:hypothetical protein